MKRLGAPQRLKKTMIDPTAFYKGKRVFVTGHTGFTGAWLLTWLIEAGATVAGCGLSPETDQSLNLFDTAKFTDKIESYILDIRDREKLSDVMTKFKPDIVFHLAAQPIVKLSYTDPETTYETNVMGTLNVLQTARKAGAKILVNITSDKAYQNNEWIWGYRENDAMGGHDMYSSSKACADILAKSFWLSFCQEADGLRLATARAGNVIGGGDWAQFRIIPDLMRAYSDGTPVEIRRPDAVRPWQHILEAVRGYMQLGMALGDGRFNGEAVNIGPQAENVVNVDRLAKRVINNLPGIKIEINSESSKDHEATLLRLDITKAREHLKWKPALDFNQTIDMTTGFYARQIDSPDNTYKYLSEDVVSYRKRLAD